MRALIMPLAVLLTFHSLGIAQEPKADMGKLDGVQPLTSEAKLAKERRAYEKRKKELDDWYSKALPEYNNAISERDRLTLENQSLKQELSALRALIPISTPSASIPQRAKVYVEVWDVGGIFKPERETEPSQERTAFAAQCSQAVASIDQQKADYTLRVQKSSNAYEVGLKGIPLQHYYAFSAFDSGGNQVAGNNASVEFSGMATEACKNILNDWSSKGHAATH
jgi:hypothetical protein